MRYQKVSYSCGAAAVVNVLQCFGKRVPERIVRARAGTCYEIGTPEAGIVKALRSFGRTTELFNERSSPVAKLRDMLGDPGYDTVAIICTEDLQHWATVIGTVGNRFIVIDSSNTKKNVKENGVWILDAKQLKKLWKSRSKRFYGIIVT